MKYTDEKIYAVDRADYLPVFARYQIVLDHGEGVYVYDTAGKKYIDFLGGIAVNVLGHAHKELVKAIADQAAAMIHVSNLYYTEAQATAAEKLVKLSGLDRVFFANCGAEANEGAIKLARKYTHQKDEEKSTIITAWHSFHGRTLATLAATGQPKYQAGFGPLPPAFEYVTYGDLAELEAKMNDRVSAVMLETIQGEGGVYVPPPEYLQGVRAICDKYGALLILDEIQCGIGRTGAFFAYESFGIKPDIVTLAKGLAGGVPIGAVITAEKVAQILQPGDHGSTFGGNPLACAAANVVLDTVANPDFLQNVARLGEYFTEALKKLAAKYPGLIKEVRGRGLMLGAELTREDIGRDIVNDVLANGAIINCTAGKVLRFLPPLIITEGDIDEVIARVDKALAKFA